GARAPAVNRGLNACDDPVPANPPLITAIASPPTAPSITFVERLIGPRGRPRSVRYQCPSIRPSTTLPRNAAPTSDWKSARGSDWRPVPAIATSVVTAITALTNPRTRPAAGRRTTSSVVPTAMAAVVAIASRTDHTPQASPTTAPAEEDRHVSSDRTNRIQPISVKNPRFTSCHNGRHHSSVVAPATISAR